jgi:rRNA-processing protein FCF1
LLESLVSEPISKSVYQTVINMLTVLAKHGDVEALEALQRADEFVEEVEWVEDEEEASEVIMETAEGNYLVTQHGVSFIPKSFKND